MISEHHLPLWLRGHLVDRNGDSLDLPACTEVFFQFLWGCTEVHILDENGAFIWVILRLSIVAALLLFCMQINFFTRLLTLLCLVKI